LIEAFDKLHKGQIGEADFGVLLDDAIKLTIKEQELAGIDLITDGEMERTSFVSFVGQRIPGFELRSIESLNPRARQILKEMKTQLTYTRAVVTGEIQNATMSLDDFKKARRYTAKPIKVTLPAPYLVMWETWHKTLSKPYYPEPEELGDAYARLLRREISDLKTAGVDFIQLDEPMLGDLTEAGEKPDRYHQVLERLYGQKYRGFQEEVRLAVDLANKALTGIDGGRVGMHMDRWPNADSPFYDQGYERFLPDLLDIKVSQFVLEFTSPGCGDPRKIAKALPKNTQLAIGCVSVRDREVETPEKIAARVERVVPILGGERVSLVPDCGFAPGMFRGFPREIAFAKLSSMARAAELLRKRWK
jgi:5-methyltetrahydropteroyltriglutamate--homocysteine methyltransferase